MEEKKVKRSKFSSNLGMMLACIGGAVGLGNVWGFPSKLGRGGGFYFLIIYVVVALLLGIPMTLSEYAIGRKMRKGPIAAWTELNRKWKFVGILNAIVCVGVMGFYCSAGSSSTWWNSASRSLIPPAPSGPWTAPNTSPCSSPTLWSP